MDPATKFVLSATASAEDGGAHTLVGAILYGSKAYQATVKKLLGTAVDRSEMEAILEED